MKPVIDKVDYPEGLREGWSFDTFQSYDDREMIALFLKIPLDDVVDIGVVYTRLTKDDVQRIIVRLIDALSQF